MRFLIFFLTLLFISCNDNDSKNNKKIYKHLEIGRLTHLDPVHCSSRSVNRVITSIYDTLYEYKYLKRPYELKPNLALKMPTISKNKLVYTIPLKRDVFFTFDPAFANSEQKKREVVATDFVYSLKRHFDPKNHSEGISLWKNRIVGLDEWHKTAIKEGANYDKEIEGLKALDSHTIQIKLKKPYPQILHTFATGFSSVVSHEIVNAYKTLDSNVVGSGPFKLKSFNKNKAILIKNDNYRREIFDVVNEGYLEEIHGDIKKLNGKLLPLLSNIEIHFGTEKKNWRAFSKNNYHFISVPSNKISSVLSKTSPLTLKEKYAINFSIHAEKKSGFVYSVFNMAHPFFGNNEDTEQNKKNNSLRQAIIKAFDWKEYIDNFYNGIGYPFSGLIPPHISGENVQKIFPKKDIIAAKKILKEAGWTAENLPLFTYPVVDSKEGNAFFQQMQKWLIEIGYPSEKIEKILFSNFLSLTKSINNKENSFYIYGWGFDYPDAINAMELFHGSSLYNVSHFDDQEYNDLYEKASITTERNESKKIYTKMNNILLEKNVGIFGFSPTKIYLCSKSILSFPGEEVLANYFKYIYISPSEKEKQKTSSENKFNKKNISKQKISKQNQSIKKNNDISKPNKSEEKNNDVSEQDQPSKEKNDIPKPNKPVEKNNDASEQDQSTKENNDISKPNKPVEKNNDASEQDQSTKENNETSKEDQSTKENKNILDKNKSEKDKK